MSGQGSNSTESSQFRSGVERLLATSNRPDSTPSESEAYQFQQSAIATNFSWERLRGMKQLRVWEFLAIHWYLDPDFLALFRRGDGRLQRVRSLASCLGPGNPLRNFVDAIPVVCSDVVQGKLHCVCNSSEALQRFTTPAWFMDYVRDKEMWSEPKRGMATICIPEDFLPRQLQIGFEALWTFYVPVSQGGGRQQPGRFARHEDVRAYLTRHGISVWLAQGVARAIRPKQAPRGRPRSVPSR